MPGSWVLGGRLLCAVLCGDPESQAQAPPTARRPPPVTSTTTRPADEKSGNRAFPGQARARALDWTLPSSIQLELQLGFSE